MKTIIEQRKMDVQVAPLRNLDDFLLTQSRFQLPDLNNAEKWFNRIVNNLLYYQTNYILSTLILFTIVTILNPVDMLIGVTIMALVFGGLYYAMSNSRQVAEFKQNHPLLVMLASLTAGYYLILQIGSLATFLLGILLPVVFALVHASLRLRNLKNKVANVADMLGVAKRTPMGIFLKEWGIEPDLKYIS